ncbi:MAG TPA: Qat anti-phage system ATPase QatA [Edaphobacter sp.]|uniref:Qat anti-phage system ATPase QatA n=1 Tax=Edaphobacter sp. TaxID=1934404 RepID=UPI002C2EFA50|nr:Qat anti-phage system ATPase QatA [Edaphobacter sp.]HUZ93605.1 Qat anti-phage system ATPase QatA [Edaphobacter sp.]
MILSDNETKVDLLNNEAIAKTIVMLLRERPDQPVTIGVHGDWGAGKSSVLEMIEVALNAQDRVLCLKFNGWRFQGFEDAKIALIEGIVTGLIEKRPLLTKAGDAVKEIIHRIDLLKLAKKAGGLALTAYAGAHGLGAHTLGIHALLDTLEGWSADPTKLTKENVESAVSGVQSILKENSETKNVPEEIAGFRKAFDNLLDKAGIDQLVVLIDDLDRCLPDTAIETLEAVRLFVFTSRTAFVVAADEAMIEYAVRKHFPDLPDTTGPQTYARNYLEKLIQIPFRIPALGETETRIYVTLLLIGAEVGENDLAFARLIAVARERLKRPWTAGALDAATVKSALAEKADRAQNALMLSDQIGPILASGTKGNPRQIKRFLNTLLLRQSSAKARGFGDEVKLPVLAKLMLAERFLPRLFDQIATAAASSNDGTCPELAALESALAGTNHRSAKPAEEATESKTPARAKGPAKLEVVKPAESALVTEWLSAPAFQSWARIAPAIGTLDLRPYLFVAKDRKDYFGATSILGRLATVAEKLLGPKIVVQAMETELRQLAIAEAGQVFEAVRTRILSSDAFDTEPAGAPGIAILVKAHPGLQGNLLDFLEALPRNRLGPWACGGWEVAIKEPAMSQRYDQLLEAWSRDGSQFLKGAASGTLRTRRQGIVR